ncbi:DUF2500 domain-containing protein [Clostridium sp. AL.422]|uniref:DUF2500 domain-containing protein n=1 Tax=Clostridium TaxID=1485 RepID=UPI00293DCA0B|nr:MULTISPECIES: DUF2500 domain-containing protein [unclassified Clostridium]MDV4149794.1 DUF2500 domain-containing protein [Clostridium sp. AL.422]
MYNEVNSFDTFSGMFSLVFILIIGVIIFSIVRGISEWSSNNKQPIIPVDSIVSGKRISVSHHNHNTGDNMHSSTSTTYYVTFQFENGERLELKVSGKEYGLISEGDRGILSFQGTRFISFERK